MSKRVYIVTKDGQKHWLVRATSQGQALKKVTDGMFSVKAATADQVIVGMNEGWEMITGEGSNESSVNRTTRA